MSRTTKTLDNSKKSANKRGENLIIRRFLSDLIREKSNVAPGDDYNYNSIDDITDSIADMTLNSVINAVVKHVIKKSSSGCKCSKCEKSEYNF